MLRSMTGFGAASVETEALKAAVTVRSVNHRYLDVSVHLSRRLQALEADFKRAVQDRVQRGRVEVAVQATLKSAEEGVLVAGRVGGLVSVLRAIQAEHSLAGEVTVSDVARFPGALEVVEPVGELAEERRRELLDVLQRALDGLDAMRLSEGAHLKDDLESGLLEVEASACRITALTEEGKAARQQALLEKVLSLAQDLGLDDARLYQEVVRAAERADVAEEVQRLKSHVAQARVALETKAPAGKRLDFLAQEMAREANTVGSKASSASVVQEVVSLKSAIERIREQVQNVE